MTFLVLGLLICILLNWCLRVKSYKREPWVQSINKKGSSYKKIDCTEVYDHGENAENSHMNYVNVYEQGEGNFFIKIEDNQSDLVIDEWECGDEREIVIAIDFLRDLYSSMGTVNIDKKISEFRENKS